MTEPRAASLDELKRAAGYGTCQCCGACCRTLIIEANGLDVIREPRIAEDCPVLDGNDPGSDPTTWSWSVAVGSYEPCPFLGSEGCSIYPTRPADCVGMEPGGPQCRAARQEEGRSP